MSKDDRLLKSVVREVGADAVRAFSSFEDLVDHLIVKGTISSREDLLKNDDLLIDVVFQWYRQLQIACVFAARLAHKPQDYGWRSEVVRPGFDVAKLNERIDELVASSEAVQLIFMDQATAKDIAKLIAKLCATDRWECHEMPWKEPEHGVSIPLGLRWQPADRSYISWALGIAPFDPMPFTRRFVGAPFTVIAFRASPPTDFIPTKTDPFTKQAAAHLAHMNDGLGKDEDVRTHVRRLTTENKGKLLSSDLRSTARAQVTFALPPWCREIVGTILKAPPDSSGP